MKIGIRRGRVFGVGVEGFFYLRFIGVLKDLVIVIITLVLNI